MFTLVFNLNIITVPLFQFNGKEFNIIVTHRFHLHIYIPVPWIQYAVLVSITILIIGIMIWLSLYRMFGSCCHLPFPEMIAGEKKLNWSTILKPHNFPILHGIISTFPLKVAAFSPQTFVQKRHLTEPRARHNYNKRSPPLVVIETSCCRLVCFSCICVFNFCFVFVFDTREQRGGLSWIFVQTWRSTAELCVGEGR